ncbi:MAG TPA: FkbM family methyltransferase [Thermoanaerobaculia bacterium]|nr:FkbM family methyltransferase [Thermoanaerobaculia bacterium]
MRLLSRLIRLPLRLVPAGRTVPILTGALRGWKWITGSATHGCWLGTYEREAQEAFRELIREGDVVYDIGANAGFFTLLASRLTGPRGTVYAFEPLPRNIDYLQRHVAVNHAANVRVLPIAVSSSTGVAHFDTASNAAMGRIKDEGVLEVQTESLDALVASGRVIPPRFMKIDVEGAELEVLHGAATLLQRHHPKMLLSTHGVRIHERCCALLEEWGYALRFVRDGTDDGQYTVVAVQR